MTDRTEEQERVDVDELLEFLNEPCTCGESPYEPCLFCNGVRDLRDHLTRLREQKDELERAARAVRDALQTEIKVDDAPGAIIQWYERMFDRLDAALDESEGRGGGETSEVERLLKGWEQAYPTDIFSPPPERPEKGAKLVWIAPDTEEHLSEPFHLDQASAAMGRFMAKALRRAFDEDRAHTPDPSEGEVRCDHENTVLDDNVEWCPDCRRVMPEDPEDAEDDGRGEDELGRKPMESLEGHARAVADEINEHGDAHPAHVDALIREARRARPTHSDADPEEGCQITARVREKGLRPAIVNGLYYWTDLDPHDDERWVVDAIVKAASKRLSRSDADPSGVSEGHPVHLTDDELADRLDGHAGRKDAEYLAFKEAARRLRRTEDAGEEVEG